MKLPFQLLSIAFLLTSCGSVLPKDADVLKCREIQGPQKVFCLQELAVQKSQPSVCDNILDPGERVACKIAVAVDTCDPSFCDTILGDWKHESCFKTIDDARLCKE